MTLSDTLFSLFQKHKLGHFYIVRGEDIEHVQSEIKKFFTLVISLKKDVSKDQAEKIQKLGHADILEVSPLEEKYKIENKDLAPLPSFLNFSPIELQHKFALINKSDQIPKRYGNKLLKTLEEAPSYSTLFFVAPRGVNLLKTIESRAIKLSDEKSTFYDSIAEVPKDEDLSTFLKRWPSESNVVIKYLEGENSLNETCDRLKLLSRSEQSEIIKRLLDWCFLRQGKNIKINEFLNILAHYHKSEIYNNSAAQRWSLILNWAQDRIGHNSPSA